MNDYKNDDDYILNVEATRLLMKKGESLCELLDRDDLKEFELDLLIRGPVLFTRVDEDGEELGMQREHWQDLKDLYL